MKTIVLASAISIAAIASPALADGHADHSKAEAKAALTVNSPIEKLMADKAAKAVVAKHMGGADLSQHPMYNQFKTMSLVEVKPWSQGAVTDAMIAAIKADLAKLS